jgi:hypothetical protein
MTLQQMQDLMGQMLEVQRQLQEGDLRNQERILVLTDSMIETRSGLRELATLVAEFVQATNTRLNILENGGN